MFCFNSTSIAHFKVVKENVYFLFFAINARWHYFLSEMYYINATATEVASWSEQFNASTMTVSREATMPSVP